MDNTFCKFCILIGLVSKIHAGPIPPHSDEVKMEAEKKSDQTSESTSESFAQAYLEKYYSPVQSAGASPSRGRRSLDSEKLAQMQNFFGLQVTGQLNSETLNVMKTPRCGLPDVVPYSIYGQQIKWQKKRLTYRIKNYTRQLSMIDVDHVIEKASQVWARVTPLTLTRVYRDPADITISFARRFHEDFFPFDGPNGTLAHAFPPFPENGDIAGDIHFDDDEMFTLRSQKGFVLFVIAVHEFGHSLGLFHSNNREAVMYPTYNYWDPDYFSLSDDDVRGIQHLYGQNTDSPDSKRPKPDNEDPTHSPNPDNEDPTHSPNPDTPPVTPNACDHKLVMDAATTLRGEKLFFKDRFLWRSYSSSRRAQQHLIKNIWRDAPDNIDAAYENPVLDKVFLFKDREFWEISHYRTEIGYPKSLSSFGLPSSVKKVNAAFYDKSTYKTWFFVGRYCYSYDEQRKSLDSFYPKLVEDEFPGMSGEITAAFQHKGHTYLFSGPYMYEYAADKRLSAVLKNNHFFNCK